MFSYQNGLLDTVTSPLGVITYAYTGGNLASVTYPDARTVQYVYEDPGYPHHLTGIIDENGVRYAFTGNVHDSTGGSTYCPGCNKLVIERDWYELGKWQLDKEGACGNCGTAIAGRFDSMPGIFGARRVPIRLAT